MRNVNPKHRSRQAACYYFECNPPFIRNSHPRVGHRCNIKAQIIFQKDKKHYLPQHFLYFLPLPQGQGSLRPTFFSAILVFGGFNNISKSLMSSGLSGSNSIVYVQPFSSNIDSNSFTLSSVCTFTIAGFFSVPNFAVFLPSNIFPIFSPLRLRFTCRITPGVKGWFGAPAKNESGQHQC